MSTNFYTYVANNASANAVNILTNGVWKQTAGTAQHNDHVLIDGGGLLVEGGLFYAGVWPSGNPLIVKNGGTINVTGGEVRWAPGIPHILGQTGTATLTLGAGATPSAGAGYLQVGNGTTGTGTVTWNATANAPNAFRQLDLQNGSFTIISGAGQIFLSSGRGSRANIEVGTTNGTAVLNKYNSAVLGGDRDATSLELLRVGANGTVNWADGDMYSNKSDNKVINQGVFNFTRASGTSNFRYGPIFQNDGTFNWTGSATMNLNPGGTAGAGTFSNGVGRLSIASGVQRTLQGNLFLGANGTFAVTLGAPVATNLYVSGTNSVNVTVNGALEVTEAAGFLENTPYNIITSSKGGSGISFVSLTLPSGYVLVDNGTSDGSVTVKSQRIRGMMLKVY